MSKDVTVCLSFDFDAMSVWIANFRSNSPNELSRGEFAKVGARRILDFLAEEGIPSTWFIPGHTIESLPGLCQRVVEEGHEVGHHGYCHENPARKELDEERSLLERGSDIIKELTGRFPRGYRAPGGSFSRNTIRLLLDHGFCYDSSMSANDFTPYYCREGDSWDMEGPYQFGRSVDIVEMPFSWHLDDFPVFEYTLSSRGVNPGLADPNRVYEIWTGEFKYLYERIGQGVFVLTMHPQTIGHAHRLLMLERFVGYLKSHDGVSFERMGDFVSNWRRVNPIEAN